MLGHTPSASLVAPLNHAYLCDLRVRLVANSKESLANPGVTTPPAHDGSYIDLGNCDQKCRYCGCLFWYAERLKGANKQGKRALCFKVSRKIYHWIGSLCPEEGHDPRLFRTARDRCSAGDIAGMKIRLYSEGDIRRYELPSSDLLGGIVFEDGPKSRIHFDVIIQLRGGPPQRINKEHQSYMSLLYPLLFVFGQPGFYLEMVLKPKDGSGQGSKVSMNAYYKYHLHPRVFEQKVNDFIRFLKLEKPFGYMTAYEVQTINGQLLPTYRAACEALGLFGDDKEWDVALEESIVSATSAELRMLFAQILVYCDVADPMKLWTKHWCAMQDDILSKVSDATGIPDY
nr:helitron helicase-like domain-containing protein [Tanacetum cinerariifolium]GEY44862.1 helitron helicase-like domain-containing protein [Tanacetum cinerariifolium]